MYFILTAFGIIVLLLIGVALTSKGECRECGVRLDKVQRSLSDKRVCTKCFNNRL